MRSDHADPHSRSATPVESADSLSRRRGGIGTSTVLGLAWPRARTTVRTVPRVSGDKTRDTAHQWSGMDLAVPVGPSAPDSELNGRAGPGRADFAD